MQNRAGSMITSHGCHMTTDYLSKPIQNVSACVRNVHVDWSFSYVIFRNTLFHMFQSLANFICSYVVANMTTLLQLYLENYIGFPWSMSSGF